MHPTMRTTKRKFHLFKIFVFSSSVTIFFLIASAAYFYHTNKPFALEIQQVRQARPVSFNIGIDVSQTIASGVLADFKDAMTQQLETLVGEQKISYNISVFGLPGCGSEKIAEVVATPTPEDAVTFTWKVKEKLRAVAIARSSPNEENQIPLTTPINRFLQKALDANPGGRIILLSDLVDDNRGCGPSLPFPEQALINFGVHPKGQIIFYYPTPSLFGSFDTPRAKQILLEKQTHFIERVQAISDAGKVRAFFYRVPDDPVQRKNFLNADLQKSIPKTNFQILWERVSKVAETYTHGFRG